MASIELLVTQTGECRYLQTPETVNLFRDQKKTVKRISHVEPTRLVLRVAFRILRLCVGEYGKAAAWTRTWPCLWQVNFAPIGGPVYREGFDGKSFQGRKAAIDFEISIASKYQERHEDVSHIEEAIRRHHARTGHSHHDRTDQGSSCPDRHPGA